MESRGYALEGLAQLLGRQAVDMLRHRDAGFSALTAGNPEDRKGRARRWSGCKASVSWHCWMA